MVGDGEQRKKKARAYRETCPSTTTTTTHTGTLSLVRKGSKNANISRIHTYTRASDRIEREAKRKREARANREREKWYSPAAVERVQCRVRLARRPARKRPPWPAAAALARFHLIERKRVGMSGERTEPSCGPLSLESQSLAALSAGRSRDRAFAAVHIYRCVSAQHLYIERRSAEELRSCLVYIYAHSARAHSTRETVCIHLCARVCHIHVSTTTAEVVFPRGLCRQRERGRCTRGAFQPVLLSPRGDRAAPFLFRGCHLASAASAPRPEKGISSSEKGSVCVWRGSPIFPPRRAACSNRRNSSLSTKYWRSAIDGSTATKEEE